MRAIELTVSGCGVRSRFVEISKRMKGLPAGDTLEVEAEDPAFRADVEAWVSGGSAAILEWGKGGGERTGGAREEPVMPWKEKLNISPELGAYVEREVKRALAEQQKGVALLVLSGDMDRVFAALAIANGAAAMGKEPTIFFTFWGVSVLRKLGPGAAKPWMEKMLGRMIPGSVDSLPVSRMNYGGLGAVFFRWWMKQKKVQSLRSMLEDAQELGVKLVACELSMEVMGIRREELIEGVGCGGVATFIQGASRAGIVMFV